MPMAVSVELASLLANCISTSPKHKLKNTNAAFMRIAIKKSIGNAISAISVICEESMPSSYHKLNELRLLTLAAVRQSNFVREERKKLYELYSD